MPAKLKVRIVAGRDLPVMDRSSELTDAFVEVKFSNTTYKTEVCRKSLNPQWNSDWFRFEVDDEDLQDEPLQIRVLDHDTYSAHDAIGKVYIELNPLLTKEHGSVISGWFPIYDTMHGIRGELNVMVKLDLFSDFNKFRQSSCGVQFFCTSGVPCGFRLHALHGFVEELVVNDDPEYQWIDKIRSQRASNEARQIQFSKLSGQLQRKLGLKVLEMGGNAVIGYRQCFDLEGESGVVVRAIGTSVTLGKQGTLYVSPHSSSPTRDLPLPEDCVVPASPTSQTVAKTSSSPTKVPHLRRSSDSDIETPPKGGSIGGSSGSGVGSSGNKHRSAHHTNVDALEFPFFSIKMFPPGFLVHLGGMVSARSVKLLDRIHNPDDPETRDVWWTELRTEIRSHARALGCHAVIGYCELTSICDEIIVLSASGTAALVNLNMDGDATSKHTPMSVSLDRTGFEKEKEKEKDSAKVDKKLHVDVNLANQMAASHRQSGSDGDSIHLVANCGPCHIPYNETSLPFPVNLARCMHCRRHKVPDVLFTTVEMPKDLPVVGKGCLLQARICRTKKEAKGESNAKEISDSLPFMEYELYNQLLNKLKLKGMNSLFGLKIQVTVGEQMLVAIATGTAVYSAPLPAPAAPKVLGKMESTDSSLIEIQKRVIDAVNRNKDIYNLFLEDTNQDDGQRANLTDDEEELSDLELVTGSRDTFILEVDDAEDAAKVAVLLEQPSPDGFEACTTEHMPGVSHLACNLQMFTRVWRGSLSASPSSSKSISVIFDALIRSIYFKLRTMTPCVLCRLDYDLELHDDDDIQVSVTGVCMGVGEPPSLTNGLMEIAPRNDIKKAAPNLRHNEHEDMMFCMDALHDSTPSSATLVAGQGNVTSQHVSAQAGSVTTAHHHLGNTLGSVSMARSVSGAGLTSTPVMYHKLGHKTAKSERRIRYYSGPRMKQGVEITPLSYVPGGKIEHYLGHLNFFIIRETTSIREIGGLSGFLHSFISEVMAICRAHVVALGGNALAAYQMTECVLDDHLHKNQGHCLVNVCGDVVLVQYETDNTHLNVSQTSSRSGGVSPVPPTQAYSRKQPQSPRHSPHLERDARST